MKKKADSESCRLFSFLDALADQAGFERAVGEA
jgi:hypothetical protein